MTRSDYPHDGLNRQSIEAMSENSACGFGCQALSPVFFIKTITDLDFIYLIHGDMTQATKPYQLSRFLFDHCPLSVAILFI